MKSYLPLGKEEYIEINWGDAQQKERAHAHIGCVSEKCGRKIAEITYRESISCLGQEELKEDDIETLTFYIRNKPVSRRGDEYSYEVRYYGKFSTRFEVKGTRVTVLYHPEADTELIVDDVFQIAVSEIMSALGNWLFHASGVSYKEQGLLLMGSSGSGKSTTCFSLLQGGFHLLGDDASLVIQRDGAYRVVPLAREVSMRLQALTLFPASNSLELYPIGERFFWREAIRTSDTVPLTVISALNIDGGKETCLQEISPQEFCRLFSHPPFQGKRDKTDFNSCMELLGRSGVRFIKGRLGISPKGILDAYIKCVENPEQGAWQAQGETRTATIEIGRNLVGKLWSSPRSTGIKDIIPLLAHPSAGLARAALNTLAETTPLSNLEPFPWEDYDDLWMPDDKGWQNGSWAYIKEWKEATKILLETADWRFVVKKLSLWIQASPILYPFLRYYSSNQPRLQAAVDKAWRDYLAQKYPPQLMLYLTDKCQLRCPYCYAGENVNKKNRCMDMEKIESLLGWAKKEGLTSISFTGGEPTLFPYFPELVRKIKEKGFLFYFATNLLFPEPLYLYVDEATSLEIHLCDVQDYSPEHIEILKRNLDWAQARSFNKLFRYNLWEENLENWEWVTKTARRFDNVTVTFAVPFPSPTSKNLFLSRNSLQKFGKTVVSFVRYCEQRGVKVAGAKPLPLCIFSEEEMNYLLKQGALQGTCEIGASGCTRNLVVDPDFNAFPCIALDTTAGTISDFTTFGALQANLKKIVKELLNDVDFEPCRDCALRDWKLCMGGCLAYYHSCTLGSKKGK